DQRLAHRRTLMAGYDIDNRTFVLRLGGLSGILLRPTWKERFTNNRVLEQIKQNPDTAPEIGVRGSSPPRHKKKGRLTPIRTVFLRILSAQRLRDGFADGIVNVKAVLVCLDKRKCLNAFLSILWRCLRQHGTEQGHRHSARD